MYRYVRGKLRGGERRRLDPAAEQVEALDGAGDQAVAEPGDSEGELWGPGHCTVPGQTCKRCLTGH